MPKFLGFRYIDAPPKYSVRKTWGPICGFASALSPYTGKGHPLFPYNLIFLAFKLSFADRSGGNARRGAQRVVQRKCHPRTDCLAGRCRGHFSAQAGCRAHFWVLALPCRAHFSALGWVPCTLSRPRASLPCAQISLLCAR